MFLYQSILTCFKITDLLPYSKDGLPVTKEFLLKVVEILIEYIKHMHDRDSKVLDFHHPAEMRSMLDLDLPDRGVSLQQLVDDCQTTLKYQVKTGTDNFPKTTQRPSEFICIFL